jgi:hypothetical protein
MEEQGMASSEHLRVRFPDENTALRIILEGTATETGERFFEALVVNLAKALNTHSAWVTELIEEPRRLRALAVWADGRLIRNFEMEIDGTPCGVVIETAELIHHPDNILEIFPNNSNLNAASNPAWNIGRKTPSTRSASGIGPAPPWDWSSRWPSPRSPP